MMQDTVPENLMRSTLGSMSVCLSPVCKTQNMHDCVVIWLYPFYLLAYFDGSRAKCMALWRAPTKSTYTS
jgi:hypothetical protein